MTPEQKRVLKVLERISEQVRSDAGEADMYADGLQIMLDDIQHNDGFGTEGQCDPRGDFRDSEWSMYNVQGIDD